MQGCIISTRESELACRTFTDPSKLNAWGYLTPVLQWRQRAPLDSTELWSV
jgi:hypothetical protein